MGKSSIVSSVSMKFLFIGIAIGIVIILLSQYAMTSTDTPQFCGGCHIMQPYAESLLQGVHSRQTCNDCHAPKPILRKIPFKAVAGAKDIFVNTFWNLENVSPTASQSTSDVIMENCMRCHTNTNMYVRVRDTGKPCWSCHRHVSHRKGAYRGVMQVGNN